MTANTIQFVQDAHDSLLSGINELTNIVKTTLGPRGKNVIIDRPNASPIITRNGREIAEMLDLPDLFMNLGVKVLRDIAVQTGDVTGKGTSTAIVLAQAIIESGFNSIGAGVCSTDFRDGFHELLKAVVSDLKSQSNAINTIEEIRETVNMAVSGDSELADLMINAFEKVGRDGNVLLENNDKRESEIRVSVGMSFQNGILNKGKDTLILKNPYILLTNERITDSSQIHSILNKLNQYRRNLLIIATEIDEDVLTWIEAFNSRHGITVSVIEAPGFGIEQKAILQDIAIFTDATVISNETGLELKSTAFSHLGYAKKVCLTRHSADIIEGPNHQTEIASRTGQIRRQMENAASDEDRLALQKRLENLTGGAAVISVGGTSKENVIQRRRLAKNALIAVKAAFSEGVVPGGGVAFLRVQQSLDNLRGQKPELDSAIDVLSKALEAPLRAIAANADEDPDTVVKKVQRGTGYFGFNAQTRTYEDLEDAGIVDPVKVLRIAIENAIHFAGLVLTTNACMTEQS